MSTAEATIRARIMGVREVTKGLSDVERGTDRVSRSSDSTTRAWGRARKAAGGLTSNLGSLAKGAVAFTGAFAAVQQIRASVTTTEDLGKSFLALRRTMGGSDKDVARWAGILKSRGIDVAKFNMSLTALGRNMLAAKDGTSDAAGMFRELGVSQETLASGDTNRVLMEMSDGLSTMEDRTKRAAIMQRLFGRGAQALGPVLVGGSKAIREQQALMDKYGVTSGISGEETKDMIAAQREASIAMLGFQLIIGRNVVPWLLKLQMGVTGVMQNLRTGDGWWKVARNTLSGTVDTIQTVVEWLIHSKTAVAILAGAVIALNIAMTASPLGMIAKALTLVVIGVIAAYKNSSTFRRVIDKLGEVARDVFPFIQGAWSAIQTAASKAWEVIGPILRKIVEMFGKAKDAVEWAASLAPGQAQTLDAGQTALSFRQAGQRALAQNAPRVTVPNAKVRNQGKSSKELGAPGGGDIVVHVHSHLDGEVVARSTVRHVARKAARR